MDFGYSSGGGRVPYGRNTMATYSSDASAGSHSQYAHSSASSAQPYPHAHPNPHSHHPHPHAPRPQATTPTRDRSAAIQDYVAKQKAMKQNAQLIRKENQRLAEARAMSASRSTKEDSSVSGMGGDEYVDDHSHIGYESGVNEREQHETGGSTGWSGRQRANTAAPTQSRPSVSTYQQPIRQPTSAQSYGYSSQSRGGASSSMGGVSVSGGGGGSSGSPSHGELVKRVMMLEDQIRLLKQQNRIFLQFMQNTEQQLAELRENSAPTAATHAHPPPRATSSEASARARPHAVNGTERAAPHSQSGRPGMQRAAYPSSASSARSTSASSSSTASTSAASSSTSNVGPLGGVTDVDQTFAPLDESESERERRERLKSAKKKNQLLRLREKMKGGLGMTAPQSMTATKQQPHSMHQPHPPNHADNDDDRHGRGYHAAAYQDDAGQNESYGYGGAGSAMGQASHPPPRTAHQRVPSASSQRRPPAMHSASPSPNEDESDDDHASVGSSEAVGVGVGVGGGGYDLDSGAIPPGADEFVETFPCSNCGRRFNAQALQKHVAKQLCKKKPRKVFNMAQKRLEELAAEAKQAGIPLPVSKKGAAAPPTSSNHQTKTRVPHDEQTVGKKQSKWRIEHEKFMAAIKAGKQLQKAMADGIPLSSLPPPPAAREEEDDRTPCPYCGRKFNATVAERHIPHCKNTKNKPKPTVASAARMGSTQMRRR